MKFNATKHKIRASLRIVALIPIACIVPAASFASRERLVRFIAEIESPEIRRDALWKTFPSFVAGNIITINALLSASSCAALSPSEAERQYDTFASTYDQLDGGTASSLLGIDEARRALMRQARGKVLEIGAGTGLNLEKYVGSQITSLTLVDISQGMLHMAQTKLESIDNLRNVPIFLVKADATSELVDRFGVDKFDTVVDSFSLCVLGDEGARHCLDQLSRVVRPNGGRVLLLENSRSSNALLGAYQDITAIAAANAGGKGCVYNQDVERLIRSTRSLQIVSETSYAAGLFRAYDCVRM